MGRIACTLVLLASWVVSVVHAQPTVVTGKVTEAASGTPIPFANVVFVGTGDGAITDFEGNFLARTNQPVDSIEVRYIGFVRKSRPVERGVSQTIHFQLDEDVKTLGEVVVYAGENPAWPILRNVIRQKPQNDKRALDAYEFESYTKIEFDIDNISEDFRNRKLIQKVTHVLDSIDQIAGEDGKPVLPVFLSEAISRFYYKKNPTFRHERVIKTKVSGLGITDGTLTSQVIGATFQEYNFYQNWLNIVGKDFVSPIADGWRVYYDYYLEDSLYLGEHYCYRIDFYPKRAQDLAFVGTMWITKDDYALKRIDATVPKSANLNYIEKIKIQEDLLKTSAGPWLPEKTRVVVDITQVTKETAGMLAKFYVSTKDHIVNQPKEDKFYMNPVIMEEEVRESSEDYWAQVRHDSLSTTEVNVFQMIDTLKKIPVVKTYTDLAKFAYLGYHKIGKVDVGPYSTFYGNNNIEGVRIGMAGRTNIDWSNKWTVGGYVGYGFTDEQWKYRVYVDRILNRARWTTLRYEQQSEVEQVWLLNENIDPTSFFYSLSRFGNLTQPFQMQKYRITGFRQFTTGFSGEWSFKHQDFQPLFDFDYRRQPGEQAVSSSYAISEATARIKWAKDELFVINDNSRLSLGTIRWPSLTFQYTYGFKGLLGSDFEYHRFKFTIQRRQKMALLGVANMLLTGGWIMGELPYTMLYNPIGNQTPFYVGFAYNLMNYFEFSMDRYVEFRYRQNFEGFLLNAVPLLKKLEWRLIGSVNMLYGTMTPGNMAMVQYPTDALGNELRPFSVMANKPYVEVGYGVENIFKVLSVEAFHRLTYLNHPDIAKFGLKFRAQIIL